MADQKELNLVDQIESSYTGEDLPAQGGFTPTIMPGIHLFQIPPNVDQLWESFDVEKRDALGNLIPDATDPTKAATEQHLMLKFSKENPLIVQGGPYDQLPASLVITTMARKRGKKDDAPVVADMTYFVRKSLKDPTPVVKRADWMAIVNQHAGHIIRLETGLSAYCDPERKRYISDGAGGVVEDPAGIMGCGKGPGGKDKARFYTNSFRVKEVLTDHETGESHETGKTIITDQITCPNCGAAIRGFMRVEKYLEPLASPAQVQG